VDGGSKDDTVHIAKRLGAHVYSENGLLGKVRYVQAELCSTEWIAVIDSDVFIYENWWDEVSKYLNNPNIGSVNGWLRGSIIDFMPSYEHFTKFATAKVIRGPMISNVAKYHTRFPFSNTLIRRELILKSKDSLANVDFGEDAVVSKNVVKWGYKIVNIAKILGLHYHSDPIGHCKMAFYRTGESIVMNRGKRALGIFFASLAVRSINWIRYSLYSKRFDFRLCRFLLSLYSEMLKGVMHAYVH